MVLSLLGLMVLIATVAPPDPGVQKGSTPTQETGANVGLSDPDAFDVSETLTISAGEEETIEAELGDRVQIVVEGREPDSVALGELRIEQLEAGIPARFELLAETPGSYPLVLVDENQRIGTLEIR
jgi:hypothetical protein